VGFLWRAEMTRKLVLLNLLVIAVLALTAMPAPIQLREANSDRFRRQPGFYNRPVANGHGVHWEAK
jgi:hypothetical protein